MAGVRVEFDSQLDILSARLEGASVVRARPSRSDRHLLLEMDTTGRIVGIEVYGPRVLRASFWSSHPDRAEFPEALVLELDHWLSQFWADLGRPSRLASLPDAAGACSGRTRAAQHDDQPGCSRTMNRERGRRSW